MKHFLVVVDIQKDFVDGALGTKEAVAIVPYVKAKIDEYVKGGNDIIYTRDTHAENYLETNEGKHLPVEHCIEGTWGWELEDSVKEAAKDAITVNKPTFGSTELAGRIAQLYTTLPATDTGKREFSIELVGLCTDICVVSNALLLKAQLPDITISVDSKCCAGVTPESHEAALTTMKMCQIEVI